MNRSTATTPKLVELKPQVDALHFLRKTGVVGISHFIVVNRHSFVFPAVPNSSIRRRLQKARPPWEIGLSRLS